MSEVKSFWCHEASNVLCVRASDFDNLTRLFLDAAERAVASERREKELQQRLTAAEEELDQCQSMALMIEEKEWAEHVGRGLISSQVESAFTQLHNELSEARQGLTAADERADVLEGLLRELLAGTGNSPGANRKYGKARAVLAGSQKQAAPEPYQGIPGTSFQRLNALANQGE